MSSEIADHGPDFELRDQLAKAIRAAVQLRIGPNAREVIERGGSMPLTPAEAEDAADAALAVFDEAARDRMFGQLAEMGTENTAKSDFVAVTRPTSFQVSCLPPDHEDSFAFSITVVYRGKGRWSAGQGDLRSLDATGKWTYGYDGPFSDQEPVADEDYRAYRQGREEWFNRHRFPLEQALKIAREAAPSVTVNNWTLADVVARDARRAAEAEASHV